MLNNIDPQYSSKTIHHTQTTSHKIFDLYGSFLENKGTKDFHESMTQEYDIMYERSMKCCIEKNKPNVLQFPSRGV